MTRTSVQPYLAVVDRNPYPLPDLPKLGLAGSSFVDPALGSTIVRQTDQFTRPDMPSTSYRTPSSPHTLGVSANGARFWLTTSPGVITVFDLDPVTLIGKPSANQVRSSNLEPQFSYVQPDVLFCVPNADAHIVQAFNVATGVYTNLFDLNTCGYPLGGTYVEFIHSSSTPERVAVLFGGGSQDKSFLVLVFDPANPSNSLLVNTLNSTVNSQPTNIPLNYRLHSAAIDRSGRYVILYTDNADQQGARKAPQSVRWDTQTGEFVEETAFPYGHDCLGFADSINQDAQGTWDADQWQTRSLLTPQSPQNVLKTVQLPKEVYIDGHSCWNNAKADGSAPVFTELYQYGSQITAGVWRAWDDEIIAIAVNMPGQDPTVWRFCHHRSDVTSDLDPNGDGFWYEPRVQVDPNGKFVLFTSNWQKTLGTDPDPGDPTIGFRQDVFLVRLDPAVAVPTKNDVVAQLGTATEALQAATSMLQEMA